ncbi:WhiB family transcriptional regulator [Mycobacterium avium subsp. hominissuis]|uniref:WhiB family transcriptional regulator n=1 Tax=Mycobacterium avium TaxID=1764 RepID=UPI001CC4B018|nr:WhiB family transcriptional regulator [Mycobacterium avium]MBZ4613586.1 transcription factor WhiB [Mycobacterium avium subsp. hominissuis]MDO2397136.1 WhiB family transcriptional regulator [Mycobacterium avium subsp. hominissuis]
MDKLNGQSGRLFHTSELTPCSGSHRNGDLWFSPFKDRIHAVRACQACPFIGRCGYNAVAVRATHGVWGGITLPGDYPERLEPLYRELLQQFERRRAAELGGLAVVMRPSADARRRVNSAQSAA